MATPKIVTALLCDDVRTENTAKDILIGVYHDGIVVNSVPAVLRMHLYLQVIFPPEGSKTKIGLRVLNPKGHTVLSGSGESTVFPVALAAIVLPIAPVRFDSLGIYKFQVRFGSSRWLTVREMNVEVNSEAPTSGGGAYPE